MTQPRRFPIALFSAALALTVASGVAAQQAKQILDTALEKYEERMRSIQDYTVVQSLMGFEVTTYYERQDVDGHTVFLPTVVGEFETQQEDMSQMSADMYVNMSKVAENATYEGRHEVDGLTTHAIKVTDLENLDFGNPAAAAPGNVEFQPEEMTMYLDTDDYVMRRFEFTGSAMPDGERKEVKILVDLGDYRTVDGLLHPFRTTIHIDGLMEVAGGASPEERAQAQEALANLEQQLASIPEGQRKMMEDMLGGQLEKLRELLSPEGGTITTEVSEVRVNTGRPSK